MITDIHDKVKPKRGIYLLPNLFTTGSLFAGFYAIVAAMNHHFDYAAIAIFVAMVLDGLDGRIARLTKTESDFGAQYDSLADMVSFGVAPALVVYNCGVDSFGKIGWLSAFVYTASTALRLARFNTQTPSKKFKGMPCPSAAGVLAGMVWVIHESGVIAAHNFEITLMMALMTVILGLLMVSSIPYDSFKELDLKGNVPFLAVFAILLAYILIAWDPPKVLFSIFTLYALSGPVAWIRHSRKNKASALKEARHKIALLRQKTGS